MLDKIVMWIPVKTELVELTSDGRHCIICFDLLDLNLKVGSYDVYKDEDGNVKTQILHHVWSKIPTSHTAMSFKLFHDVPGHPYVELKCSPAKIMQGHNVYGTDWIEEGALEMLGFLAQSNSALYDILDVGMTEVKQLDATYSFRFRDDREAEKVLALMRNVSTQHIRKSTKDAMFKNTLYFGSERYKRFARKVYVKSNEFQEQLQEQLQEQIKLAADLIDASFSGTYLQRLHEKPSQNFSRFDVYIQIFKAFSKEIPAGTVSDRKARNIERFYYDLEKFGFDEMRTKYSKAQFCKLVAALEKCGYSKVYIQNLHVQSSNNVIPFIKMFEMKFEDQLPPNFIEPVSTFSYQLRTA